PDPLALRRARCRPPGRNDRYRELALSRHLSRAPRGDEGWRTVLFQARARGREPPPDPCRRKSAPAPALLRDDTDVPGGRHASLSAAVRHRLLCAALLRPRFEVRTKSFAPDFELFREREGVERARRRQIEHRETPVHRDAGLDDVTVEKRPGLLPIE